NLCDVADIVAYSRTKDQSNHAARRLVNRNKRRFGIEGPTARKPNNIVQKTQRTTQAAVLIVNLGINVSSISSGNYSRSGLVVLLGPAADFNFPRHPGWLWGSSVQRQGHEKPPVALESLIQKRTRHNSRQMHQQLRFNTLDAGGLL